MILSFKQKFADGTPTHFKEKIYAGIFKANGVDPEQEPKIHSMRTGERWKAGNSIQMAYGVRTKDYECFNAIPFCIGIQKCISVQKVLLGFSDGQIGAVIDGVFITDDMIDILIKNDGLTKQEFLTFFFPGKKGKWEGQLIHWTNFKY